ncbi:hypothetical protein ACFQ71_40180 [Streptomyces sp. NPDC056534]|uniref:hypothetical protein n=1 Tax=Streptomyces sp. NPDC056534 TaxID=3345857 RepID=UPI00368628F4
MQSGGKNTSGSTGKGNPWLRGALGEAAISAARTDTFLGARYRRIIKRRGHMKALVAVARSILVSVWHPMTDPTARYRDLGADFHTRNLDPGRKSRDLVRQLKDLGHDVTLPRQPPDSTQDSQHTPPGDYFTMPTRPLRFPVREDGTRAQED